IGQQPGADLWPGCIRHGTERGERQRLRQRLGGGNRSLPEVSKARAPRGELSEFEEYLRLSALWTEPFHDSNPLIWTGPGCGSELMNGVADRRDQPAGRARHERTELRQNAAPAFRHRR